MIEALLMRGGRWRWIDQTVLVGVLQHPLRGLWLLDTGLHKRLYDSVWTSMFLRCGQARVLAWQLPRAPKGIFLTHFHLDHAAGLRDFPGVPIVASRQGFLAIQGLTGFRALRAGWQPGLLPEDFEQRALWIEDLPLRQEGQVTGFDLFGDGTALAVPLPGHAPGQFGLLTRTERGTCIFLGDAAGHPDMIYRHAVPLLPKAISHDRAAEKRTLEWIRSLPVDWELTVSHFR